MFDPGFSELVLIMIIALLVVGPERLPRMLRTVGRYAGKARAMFENVRSDVQQELAAEELKRTLEEQANAIGMHEIIEETQSDLNTVKDSVAAVGEELKQSDSASSKPDNDAKP